MLFLVMSALGGGIRALQDIYGPNLLDAQRRKRLRELERLYWSLQLDYGPDRQCLWWPALAVMPPLADYQNCIRTYEALIATEQLARATSRIDREALPFPPQAPQLPPPIESVPPFLAPPIAYLPKPRI